MTTTPSFSQKQKLPNGNDFYHTYEKKENIIYIYDIDNKIVREAHLNKKIAYNFYDENIFRTHLKNSNIINTDFIKSKKSLDYLYTSTEREDVIQMSEELGYIKKFKTNPYGFREMIFSSSIDDNPILPPEISDEEIKKRKLTTNDKSSNVNSRLEKVFHEEQNIHSSVFFKNELKELEFLVKFNEQGLISNSFSVETTNIGTPKEQKNIIYKKAIYNDKGNLTELREWRSKDYNQFKKIIGEKGYDCFLNMIFKNTTTDFKLNPLDTLLWEYNNQELLVTSKIIDSSNNEIIKEEYLYDDKKLIKIISSQKGEILGTDTFKYD